MAGSGRKSAADVLAAELAVGRTVKEAAATAGGVAERTAYRRLSDPAFKARVSAIRGDMAATTASRLADVVEETSGALRALLSDQDPIIRCHAAEKVIRLGAHVCELAELQQRVTELEDSLAQTGPGARRGVVNELTKSAGQVVESGRPFRRDDRPIPNPIRNFRIS